MKRILLFTFALLLGGAVNSAMAQEKIKTIAGKIEGTKLRASDKQQPDSVVEYNEAGYKRYVYYEVKNRMPTPYFDESFRGGKWMFPSDHCTSDWFSTEYFDVKYNLQGLVESISNLTEDKTYVFIRRYQYDENGYLLLIESFVRPAGSNESKWEFFDKDSYFYDAYGNWVGSQIYGGAIINGENISQLYSTYKAHVDSRGRIVHSYTTMGKNSWFGEVGGDKIRYLIWYYSDHTPNVETSNNNPTTTNEGGFDLNVNIPADSIASGSVTVTLPEGLTLDETNTALAIDVAGLFDLTITKQEDNSWLIGIKLKALKSGTLKADEVGTTLHVAYKVDDTLPKGTYAISVNSILFETPGGNLIPEPAITVPVNLNRWPTPNDNVEAGLTVWARDGQLYVSGLTLGEAWSVYSVTGAVVYNGTADSGEAVISLSAAGIYIVRTGGSTVKVAATN